MPTQNLNLSGVAPENSSDVTKIVDDIFFDAVGKGASDIHFEPLKKKLMVRYRVDGTLNVVFEADSRLYESMLARIKVMAQMQITGLPRPQEGNIRFKINEEFEVDLRVSIFPVSYGECVVVRILESKLDIGDYSNLGFSSDQVRAIEKIIQKPYGLILVTGPTGSGKSTTIFSMLSKLNDPGKSLVTLEDPVERKIDMVRQTNIDHEHGFGFADGLRYLMRQDPDIIMVGEIRDRETAKIAVQAAITGHLVLATIHTNSAAGAIVRLINMEVEPFLLASALKFVSSQRLARTNCPFCKAEYQPPKDIIEMLKAPSDIKFFRSTGCDECHHKGVKGRKAVHEVLVVSHALEDLIMKRPSDEQIKEVAIREGMLTLRQVALQRVYDGDISLEEAMRLTE